tara:strand:+ start:854 stop:1567 length:714 start_codon:yes stop_codon:yes gene_type:complete
MSEEQAAEQPVSDTLLDSSEPTLAEGEYFLSDGIKGTGDVPEWLDKKYKSVADQAKGYAELSKKFGGFKGSPKDGYTPPEGIEKDDALYQELEAFANKTNMSADAFGEAWELLTAQEQAVQEVSQEEELAKLGDNAQERIKTVEGFMKNNLDPETYEHARGLVTTADTIELVEMLVRATAPAKLPMEGGHNPQGLSWEAIETEMFKKDEQGQLLRSTNIDHERKIQKMMEAWGGSSN